MTENSLVKKEKDDFRIVIVPKKQRNCRYVTWETTHPVSQRSTTFVIEKDVNNVSKNVYIMDKMEWVNKTVRNQETTVSGKAYRSLFVTQEGLNDALVLGDSPEVYALSLFSPVYFLLAYFKPLLIKNQGDEDNANKRLVSYEDLVDSITESNLPVSKLITEFNMDLNQWIQLVCDRVSVPSMDSDDEDGEGDVFYKPSMKLITSFIESKIQKIIELASVEDKLKTLKLRMQTMYPGEIPEDINSMLWRKQAEKFISLFVDEWYMNETSKAFPQDFQKLDQFMVDSKKKVDAQAVLQESLESMQNGSGSMSGKKSKTVKSTKPVKKAPVKVKSGALDMFFKKKET